jgi:hypothetical protein
MFPIVHAAFLERISVRARTPRCFARRDKGDTQEISVPAGAAFSGEEGMKLRDEPELSEELRRSLASEGAAIVYEITTVATVERLRKARPPRGV